ncbi:MAG TPA: hypothetical protein ACHBX0_09345 [Arsenophonus sp.]
MTQLRLVSGRNPATMLYALLPHLTDEKKLDVATNIQCAEKPDGSEA